MTQEFPSTSGSFSITSGSFVLCLTPTTGGFGVAVFNSVEDSIVYSHDRPAAIELRDYSARNVTYASSYQRVTQEENELFCCADIITEAGSHFTITDRYRAEAGMFCIRRTVQVCEAAADDVGYASRYTVGISGPASFDGYDFFAPGAWYKDNQGIREHGIYGTRSHSHYWYRETRYTLPLFMMQRKDTGTLYTLCHLHPELSCDVYDRTTGWREWLNSPGLRYGSIGTHKENGHVFLDYVYPAHEGADNIVTGMHNRADKIDVNWLLRSHPVVKNATQEYELALRVSRAEDYYEAIWDTWRFFYDIFHPTLVRCDQDTIYRVGIELCNHYARDYHGAPGLPLTVNLPNGEPDNVSFQMGFVGQQIGIAYHLMRYGDENGCKEMTVKGRRIIQFWVDHSMTDWGLPMPWYNVTPPGFHDCPIMLRIVADGLESVLDAYRYALSIDEIHPDWLDYCITAANWFVNKQNPDGSWYRSFDHKGNLLSDSPYNTSNPIRFLVNMYFVTGNRLYYDAVLKAADFCYEHIYRQFRFYAACFDKGETPDKEAGIYAMWAFLAIYDMTDDGKWLKAARDVGVFTETWVYAYEFKVNPQEPHSWYHKRGNSGQSIIGLGGSGCDLYMAICPFFYYRLYLLTKESHFLDFSRFLLHNTKQGVNWDGKLDYKFLGLVEEGADISMFTTRGTNLWLPWCTFVQLDPILRFRDVFGVSDIDDIHLASSEGYLKKIKGK